ncbi:T9SS type A sorting domain-containing protein [Aquimarina pacifica]|uniref:T9SS type A sorting domain-containing protein n=1 Tax=Aquimarina pacifica TaxID=1296415 RepID=UPI00046F6C76|nr:T9SS type A sorting domain-containing protein [Aquimarina pacifica]
MNKYILTILLLAINFSSHCQTTAISPSIDLYAEISNPNTSFGTEGVLKLKHTFSESNERVSILKFLKSEMPDDYQQVLLKLVKIGGHDGNISVLGLDTGFGESTTWNTLPTDTESFTSGGFKENDIYYIDVTEYINHQFSNSSQALAFKIFTTSIISSPILLGSNEASDSNDRPQLLFYDTTSYNIPVYDIYNTVSIETEKGDYNGNLISEHDESENRNTYGGWTQGSSTATGFFRVEKDCENTWHIIDPEGAIFYSAGLNSVIEGGGLSQPTILKDMGINTMGCWSDENIDNIAYTPRFNVIKQFNDTSSTIENTYELDVLPVFEPTFESFCQNLAATQLAPYLNDPWVLGYFLDNELPFYKYQLSLSLQLSNDNAQFKEANSWMQEKYGTGYSINDITEDDELEYQGYVAETYFRIVSEAFRSVDPNHMLLGTRYHGGGKYVPQLFEAAGKYMDIISVNYYNRFEPEEEHMDMWLDASDTPFIITEFYVKGDDSGLGNEDGAGWTVPTQQDRANWYENWMLKLLRNKGNVGFHWFRFIDKAGNDSNKGVFSEDFELYEELGASIKKVSKSIYSLRSQILYGNHNYNECDIYIPKESENCTSLRREELIGKTVRIANTDADLWAQISSTANYANVRLATTNYTGTWTQWEIEEVPSEDQYYYRFKNVRTGKRLRATSNSKIEIAPTTFTGTWTQWEIIPNDSEGYTIKNVAWDTYLNLGTNINLSSLQHNTNASIWTLLDVDNNNSVINCTTSNKSNALISQKIEDLKLFPNPFTNYFTIDLGEKANSALKIYSISGQLLISKNLTTHTNTIHTDGLNNAIYIMEISNEDGTKNYKKIIKNK